MIIWLFGNAQTMKKRRARLAGAGVPSSAGTVRNMMGFSKKCLYRAKVSEDRHNGAWHWNRIDTV